MRLTAVQRIYFIAAAAPLVVAVLFSGDAGATAATGPLACTVAPPAAESSAGEASGAGVSPERTTPSGYGYGY